MLGAIGKVAKMAGKAIGKKVKSNVQQSNLGKGIAAFKSWKAKKNEAGGPPSGMIKGGAVNASPAPKRVGEFNTGIDTNLKPLKVSQLGRGELFKTGM